MSGADRTAIGGHVPRIADKVKYYLRPRTDHTNTNLNNSMTRQGHIRALVALTMGMGLWAAQAFGQGDCQNENQYPSGTITPNSNGTVTTISTCSFQTEYSHITDLVNGGTYQFVIASGYITVREGSFDGPVVAEGSGTVDVLSNGSDLFPHWTVDETCATATGCIATTVQFLLDCVPPVATFSVNEDCSQGTFTISVEVVSVGDGAAVNIVYDVFGLVETIAGVGPGTYDLGPFINGDVVDVSVQHESDFLCNVNFGAVQSPFTCPPADLLRPGPQLLQLLLREQRSEDLDLPGHGPRYALHVLRIGYHPEQLFRSAGDL